MTEDEDITRDDDDRIEECTDCGDEACVCDRICHKCNLWLTHCICPPVIAHKCSDCGEVGEAELDAGKVDGQAVTFPVCGVCQSTNIKPVDEAVDAAEYSKGER